MLKKIGLSLATVLIGALAASAQTAQLNVAVNGVAEPCIPSNPCIVTTGTGIEVDVFGPANGSVVVNRTFFPSTGGEFQDQVTLGTTNFNGFYKFTTTYGCDRSIVGTWQEEWVIGGVKATPDPIEVVVNVASSCP